MTEFSCFPRNGNGGSNEKNKYTLLWKKLNLRASVHRIHEQHAYFEKYNIIYKTQLLAEL